MKEIIKETAEAIVEVLKVPVAQAFEVASMTLRIRGIINTLSMVIAIALTVIIVKKVYNKLIKDNLLDDLLKESSWPDRERRFSLVNTVICAAISFIGILAIYGAANAFVLGVFINIARMYVPYEMLIYHIVEKLI